MITGHLMDVVANIAGLNGELRELALFAGAGGGILGGKLLGWRTICAVERDAYAAQILAQRQNDGILQPFPIWSDVQGFDGKPWRGLAHVVSGGFPCQDISIAGKGAGIDGKRSGLWFEFARIIGEIRPIYAYIENSPAIITNGLERLLADLAGMGMDAKWGVFRASSFGACHHRNRFFMVAYPHGSILEGLDIQKPICIGSDESRRRQFARAIDAALRADDYTAMPRNSDGLARGMDRLKATGNGQVPTVAAAAFNILSL
jgi:DNA (cytosine-5)-methyltransferase 1